MYEANAWLKLEIQKKYSYSTPELKITGVVVNKPPSGLSVPVKVSMPDEAVARILAWDDIVRSTLQISVGE